MTRLTHITPVRRELHWLPVAQRINFKVALLTYKALHGLAPEYLTELLIPYTPCRPLRSEGRNLLVPKSFDREMYGGRSFASRAPVIWNSLPNDIRSAPCLVSFKSKLKTHLFREAYDL